MTGLLQRLGARATGQAWAVRADTRLPFGAERMAPLPAAMDAAPAQAAVQPHGVLQQQRADTGSVSAPLEAQAMPHALLPAARTTQQTHAAQASPANATATRMQQHPRMPATPLRSSNHAPDAQPQPASEPARARAEATAPATSTAAADSDMPQPLLPTTGGTAPRQPRVLHAAWPATAAIPTGAQRTQAAAPQETEVHIHIGRIDVTALHEAPRAKARPRERAQPMSLDAYLARRKDST
ncbi:MAG TPA: hypothetical protein VMS38_13750 [Pseudorhodoferax sp.]|nr:hypothetical protein [Pseudorhodoferax sp.]